MNEHEFEPIPGLPEDLHEDEGIIWQGAPDWRVVARQVFHLRMLAIYFVLLVSLRVGILLTSGAGFAVAAKSAALIAILGLIAAGLFVLYARLIASTTLYTITNKRLVMRFGVALPMSINIPFSRIKSAHVKCFAGDFGDIPLTVDDTNRVGYLVMWPHARPWQLKRPEPMLRCIPNASKVSEIIADTASSTLAATKSAAHSDESSNYSDSSQQMSGAT